jgi:hypothetical protein
MPHGSITQELPSISRGKRTNAALVFELTEKLRLPHSVLWI